MTDISISEDQTHIRKGGYQGLGAIARGGGISLVGAFLIMVFGVVYQFAIARLLGPANVGIINLGSTLWGLFMMVILFGLDKSVVRFVGYYVGMDDRQREAGTILSALKILLTTVFLFSPLLFLAAEFLAQSVFNKPDLAPVLRILALSLPFIVLVMLSMSVVQAYRRLKYRLVIEQITVPVIKILGVFLFVYLLGRTSVAAAYAILLSSIVGFIFSVYVVRRLFKTRLGKSNPIGVGRDLVQFSWPFILTGLIYRANVQTETLVLGAFASSEQVGIYTICLKATVFVGIFLQALNVIFAPIISKLYARGNMERLSYQFKTVTRWAFTFAFPVALVMVITPADVLAVFGPEFVAGVPVLRLLALSQLVFVVTGPVALMLGMTDYPRLELVNTIIALILSLALDLALIPKFGALGAAVAAMISIASINLLYLGSVYVVLRLHPYDWSYLKPLFAGVVAALITLGCNIWLRDIVSFGRLFLLSVILLTVYGSAILLLRLSDKDREILALVLGWVRGTGTAS